MKLTILGTSCSIPTKERNTSGYFLRIKNHGILFDCGEGTQRQMKLAGLKLSKITIICITHWHGDHVLGLGGLLQSIQGLDHVDTLKIFGPQGTKQYFAHLFDSLSFDLKISLDIHEITSGIFYENETFYLETLPMKHNIPCQGYSLIEKDKRRIHIKTLETLGIPAGPLVGKLQRGEQITHKGKTVRPEQVSRLEKGKKFCYITDTLPNNNAITLANDADLLLSECVYDHSMKAKARQHHHLTAQQAGHIASKANAKKLVLTHFSARYKETSLLEQDARAVFDNVISAEDFMTFTL
ncbi:ribonuclease Z [Candidatus Woesearchaeota archaeon]|nr:ribonuclease Z [Candidatus Woesearchaeota archaeon]